MPREVFHMDVWFGGRVQGVGFRFQTLQVARGFEVTGRVKNLNDGRVFLQAEGAEREVAAFVAEVRRQLGPFIREAEEKSFSGVACFTDFQIVR